MPSTAAASAVRQRLGWLLAEDLSIPPGKPAKVEETAVHCDLGHCCPRRRLAERAPRIIQSAADERLRRRATSEAAKGILHGAYTDIRNFGHVLHTDRFGEVMIELLFQSLELTGGRVAGHRVGLRQVRLQTLEE
jgi:hypothetical protein